MALSHVVSEIYNVKKYRDLEFPVKGQSRSLKVVPFDRLDMVSYKCSICPQDAPFSRYIRLQKCSDLENRVRGPSRSLKMSPSRTVSEINGDFSRKSQNFRTTCILHPR